MNHKQEVATNHSIKQMFKRCQDFERMLLTSDLDDKNLELDKIRKRVGRLARRVTASVAEAAATTTTKEEGYAK
jgi:hypothetical protein